MPIDGLDPLIHAPARLRIMATLAALSEGDALSFTRLQGLIGLTSGNLITHLRKLEDAGHVNVDKSGNGAASLTTVSLTTVSLTTVSLTQQGLRALDAYTVALRDLIEGL